MLSLGPILIRCARWVNGCVNLHSMTSSIPVFVVPDGLG